MKTNFISILLITLLAFSLQSFTVVIDAGHGGKDPGAIGSITKEKDLNLAVSKRLQKLIEDNEKDVTVVMTRKTDVFLTLQERADIVNKNNADLFICIHTNSAENKSSNGTETFTLGLNKLESNLAVAMRENSVMTLEDDYKTRYQGFDPNSVESYIMFEFLQDRYIDKSLQFASLVQSQFANSLHRHDRGVRQAAFWVLHKSAAPSVLIEMGFITNKAEEQYLASDKGKDEIAGAIYKAFVNYKNGVDTKIANSQATANTEKAEEKTDKKAEDKKTETTIAKDDKKTKEQVSKSAKPVYRVQILTVREQLPAKDPSFKGLKNCKFTKDGNFYKYTYGEDTDFDTIKQLRSELQSKFPDCFVVAFLNGKQIPIKEALQLSAK